MHNVRQLTPDPASAPGSDSDQRPVGAIPTGMETDPTADREVINQRAGEQYPGPVEQPDEQTPAKIAPDNLADSIAYALDGSGPGPTNATPNVSGHKVITEGITGANLDEEADALRV